MAKGESQFHTELAVGPMYTRGDLAKAPQGTSPKCRNLILRRGEIVLRDAFTQDRQFDDSSNQVSFLRNFTPQSEGGGASYLIASGTTYGIDSYSKSWSRKSNTGTWSDIANTMVIRDATVWEDRLFMSTNKSAYAAAGDAKITSWDGLTEVEDALVSRLGFKCLTTYGGRIIGGGAKIPKDGTSRAGAYDADHDDSLVWTVVVMAQPVADADNNMVVTVVNGNTDEIYYSKSSNVMLASIASEQYYTASQWVKPMEEENDIPLVLVLEDDSGNVISQNEYLLENKSDNPEWQQIWTTGLVPASTNLTMRLKVGNTSGPAIAGDKFIMGNNTAFIALYGSEIYPGSFVLPDPVDQVAPAAGTYDYKPNNIYWSEALGPTEWLASSFIIFDDVIGDFTSLEVVNGKVVAFKKGGVMVLRPIPGPEGVDQPFVREDVKIGIGTFNPNSSLVYQNTLFFLDSDNLYAFSGQGKPMALLKDGMRDEIFPIDAGYIAVDEDNDELWFVVTEKGSSYQTKKIWVFSLETQSIVGYYQFTDSTGSEDPVNASTDINGLSFVVEGMAWHNGTMWVNIRTINASGSISTYEVGKLNSGATQDTLDNGTSRYIDAEYQFHVLESGAPRTTATVQRLGLKHKITGDQTNATVKLRVSNDGGDTWRYKTVRITRKATAGKPADSRLSRAYIHRTGNRHLMSLVYNGPSGRKYFNISGGVAEGIMRGVENQVPNDTYVGTGTE